jgi:hypothetical protein
MSAAKALSGLPNGFPHELFVARHAKTLSIRTVSFNAKSGSEPLWRAFRADFYSFQETLCPVKEKPATRIC